jgi:PhnB protein
MPFPQIVPMLSYEDVGAAADWLVRAFGFEEVERFDWEGEVGHVTLRLGSGMVMLGRPGASYVNPKRLREQCEAAAEMYSVPWVIDGVWVQVDDVEAHYERAQEAGATLLSEIENGHGERLYRVEDHAGHRWMFAQSS